MPHPYQNIPELFQYESQRGLIRIPMEQDIPFTPRVRSLVDTPEYRRLSKISQLGLAAQVYPGATHSRFEHALGVFHNAIRYVIQLATDARFTQIVSAHHVELLLASALLHDLGHWPFCHPIEDMELADLPPHEEFISEFLSPKGEVSRVLKDEWNVETEEVQSLLAPKTANAQNDVATRMLRSILSGPIDIDKMDYLDRDSLHAGVPYGRNFDRNRLISSLLLNEAGDGLAISIKGKTAAELMVFARYVMFSEVYWHHAVRSATSMFAHGFYRVYRQLELRSLFRMSESEMIATLRNESKENSAFDLFDGIFGERRRLFKCVAEYSMFQNRELYQKLAQKPFSFFVKCARILAKTIEQHQGFAVPESHLIIDGPPTQREIEFKVDIYFPRENVYRSLREISSVVDGLARTQFDDSVKKVRLFSHPNIALQLTEVAQLDRLLEQAIQNVDGKDSGRFES